MTLLLVITRQCLLIILPLLIILSLLIIAPLSYAQPPPNGPPKNLNNATMNKEPKARFRTLESMLMTSNSSATIGLFTTLENALGKKALCNQLQDITPQSGIT